MHPMVDPTADRTLDLASNGPERWFATSWRKCRRQQKQEVPVTSTIHLHLAEGELPGPGMHSTIIELALPGCNRVESKLSITTNSIKTRNFLHMAVLLLNEVYILEDDMWRNVRGVSSEEDEMIQLLTWSQGAGADLASRGDQLISLMYAEVNVLALEAWNLWVNTRTEKLPEEQDKMIERAANALELCIKKEPENHVAHSLLMIFASQKQGIPRKDRKALEKEALITLELTVKKDLAYYVARSYLVAVMIEDATLTQAKEQGLKICDELCKEHLAASLLCLGNGARLPIFGLFFQLAEASKISGERTQAIKFAQMAANLFPTDPNPHMMLGELLHGIGAYAESAQECQLALVHHANLSSPAIRHPSMCHAYWTLLPQDYQYPVQWSTSAKFDELRKRTMTWNEIASGLEPVAQRNHDLLIEL